MSVVAADPASKVARTFSDPSLLAQAIQTYGFIPLRPSGDPMQVYSFEGGLLLDGAPFEPYFKGYWYEGQKTILQPLWNSGQIMTPPPYILNLPEQPAPPDVLKQYAAYKNVPDATSLADAFARGGTASTVILVGLAAFALWALIPSAKHARRATDRGSSGAFEL